jgi:hypothetical protein
MLFLKAQMTPKQMSGNLEACSFPQDIQNSGAINEENGVDRGETETIESLPEPYTEVRNEPPSETGVSAPH